MASEKVYEASRKGWKKMKDFMDWENDDIFDRLSFMFSGFTTKLKDVVFDMEKLEDSEKKLKEEDKKNQLKMGVSKVANHDEEDITL